MNGTKERVGVSVLQVAVGVVFLIHGLAKVFVFTLPGTAQFFAAVGYPGWLAYPVTALEVVGGGLLVFGVARRWIAAALIPVALGAATVHLGNGFMFNNEGGGWEFPVFLAATLVTLTLLPDARSGFQKSTASTTRR